MAGENPAGAIRRLRLLLIGIGLVMLAASAGFVAAARSSPDAGNRVAFLIPAVLMALFGLIGVGAGLAAKAPRDRLGADLGRPGTSGISVSLQGGGVRRRDGALRQILSTPEPRQSGQGVSGAQGDPLQQVLRSLQQGQGEAGASRSEDDPLQQVLRSLQGGGSGQASGQAGVDEVARALAEQARQGQMGLSPAGAGGESDVSMQVTVPNLLGGKRQIRIASTKAKFLLGAMDAAEGLRASGLPATAVLEHVRDTGVTVNERHLYLLDLRVEAPGQAPRQVAKHPALVPLAATGRVVQGAAIAAKVDPAGGAQILLEWT